LLLVLFAWFWVVRGEGDFGGGFFDFFFEFFVRGVAVGAGLLEGDEGDGWGAVEVVG